jgi:hypothetical protein
MNFSNAPKYFCIGRFAKYITLASTFADFNNSFRFMAQRIKYPKKRHDVKTTLKICTMYSFLVYRYKHNVKQNATELQNYNFVQLGQMPLMVISTLSTR